MCCDSQIHDDLKNLEVSTCPFCDQILIEGDKEAVSCCNAPDIENKNGINICKNCGLVHGYNYENVNEYINFYDNIHKMHKKSVYHRKYHIENVLNNICCRNGVELTHDERDRIYKIFIEIDTILPLVNKTRKRMISVNYIIRMLLKMMKLPYNKISISRSKKTLAFYNKYWASIISLIGNKIESILNRSSDYICYQIYRSMARNPTFT